MGNEHCCAMQKQSSNEIYLSKSSEQPLAEAGVDAILEEEEQMEEYDNPSRTFLNNNFLHTSIIASNDLLVTSSSKTSIKTQSSNYSVLEVHRSNTNTTVNSPSFFTIQSTGDKNQGLFKQIREPFVQDLILEQSQERKKKKHRPSLDLKIFLQTQPEVHQIKNLTSSSQEDITETKQVETIVRQLSDYVAFQRYSSKNYIEIKKEQFIKMKEGNINQHYKFLVKIGEGTFGSVYKAQCLKTHEIRAIKVLKKREFKSTLKQKMLAEMEILKKLDHPNIIKLFEVYISEDNYYIVMELCEGGSLLRWLKGGSPFNQNIIKKILNQLLSAVKYMHSMNIIHRDLKLQNLVFVKKIKSSGSVTDSDITIKIIDFGLSKILQFKKQKDRNQIGTLSHMSPEVLEGIYSEKCDIWACGIILHVLLTGMNPFRGKNKAQTLQNIKHHDLTFKNHCWRDVALGARELVMRMLDKSHLSRISANQALNSSWLVDKSTMMSSHKICTTVTKKIEQYYRSNSLMSFIQSYLSFISTTQEKAAELMKMFQSIDKNHNGTIQLNELEMAFKKADISQETEALKYMLCKIDKNRSGKIDFSQFITVLSDRKELFSREALIQAFNFFDNNGNGFLQRQELISTLKNCPIKEIEQILEAMDENGDNIISQDQFLKYAEKFK